MSMMGLDLVEKEAQMMYHTQKGLKDSQNSWTSVTLIGRNLVKVIEKVNQLFLTCKSLIVFLLNLSSIGCCIFSSSFLWAKLVFSFVFKFSFKILFC